jgi:hypothetical protein
MRAKIICCQWNEKLTSGCQENQGPMNTILQPVKDRSRYHIWMNGGYVMDPLNNSWTLHF